MTEAGSRRTSGVRINRDRLRRRREVLGLNQARLADATGFSFGYIAMIERGERPTVSPDALARLCDALGFEDREELIDDGDSDEEAA